MRMVLTNALYAVRNSVMGVFNNKYSAKEYHGSITLHHKKDDLLSLVTLENANKNYDSKTEVKKQE